mgnify:CR=1 FL=1
MKKLIMLFCLMCLCLGSAWAGTPVLKQGTNGAPLSGNNTPVTASATPFTVGAPNMVKMSTSPATITGRVNYESNPFESYRNADGTYEVIAYFDPHGIEAMDDDANRDFRDGKYDPSKGFTYKVFLGNLVDKQQRKFMPEDVFQPGTNRVTFHNVHLTQGKTERLNMPIKLYRNGAEVKFGTDSGYVWGWIGTECELSIVGTPDNGYSFTVQPDGTLKPAGNRPAL